MRRSAFGGRPGPLLAVLLFSFGEGGMFEQDILGSLLSDVDNVRRRFVSSRSG